MNLPGMSFSIQIFNYYCFFNRALPIVRALELGADVVVTGRCTDSALALGPLMYEVKYLLTYKLVICGPFANYT